MFEEILRRTDGLCYEMSRLSLDQRTSLDVLTKVALEEYDKASGTSSAIDVAKGLQESVTKLAGSPRLQSTSCEIMAAAYVCVIRADPKDQHIASLIPSLVDLICDSRASQTCIKSIESHFKLKLLGCLVDRLPADIRLQYCEKLFGLSCGFWDNPQGNVCAEARKLFQRLVSINDAVLRAKLESLTMASFSNPLLLHSKTGYGVLARLCSVSASAMKLVFDHLTDIVDSAAAPWSVRASALTLLTQAMKSDPKMPLLVVEDIYKKVRLSLLRPSEDSDSVDSEAAFDTEALESHRDLVRVVVDCYKVTKFSPEANGIAIRLLEASEALDGSVERYQVSSCIRESPNMFGVSSDELVSAVATFPACLPDEALSLLVNMSATCKRGISTADAEFLAANPWRVLSERSHAFLKAAKSKSKSSSNPVQPRPNPQQADEVWINSITGETVPLRLTRYRKPNPAAMFLIDHLMDLVRSSEDTWKPMLKALEELEVLETPSPEPRMENCAEMTQLCRAMLAKAAPLWNKTLEASEAVAGCKIALAVLAQSIGWRGAGGVLPGFFVEVQLHFLTCKHPGLEEPFKNLLASICEALPAKSVETEVETIIAALSFKLLKEVSENTPMETSRTETLPLDNSSDVAKDQTSDQSPSIDSSVLGYSCPKLVATLLQSCKSPFIYHVMNQLAQVSENCELSTSARFQACAIIRECLHEPKLASLMDECLVGILSTGLVLTMHASGPVSSGGQGLATSAMLRILGGVSFTEAGERFSRANVASIVAKFPSILVFVLKMLRALGQDQAGHEENSEIPFMVLSRFISSMTGYKHAFNVEAPVVSALASSLLMEALSCANTCYLRRACLDGFVHLVVEMEESDSLEGLLNSADLSVSFKLDLLEAMDKNQVTTAPFLPSLSSVASARERVQLMRLVLITGIDTTGVLSEISVDAVSEISVDELCASVVGSYAHFSYSPETCLRVLNTVLPSIGARIQMWQPASKMLIQLSNNARQIKEKNYGEAVTCLSMHLENATLVWIESNFGIGLEAALRFCVAFDVSLSNSLMNSLVSLCAKQSESDDARLAAGQWINRNETSTRSFNSTRMLLLRDGCDLVRRSAVCPGSTWFKTLQITASSVHEQLDWSLFETVSIGHILRRIQDMNLAFPKEFDHDSEIVTSYCIALLRAQSIGNWQATVPSRDTSQLPALCDMLGSIKGKLNQYICRDLCVLVTHLRLLSDLKALSALEKCLTRMSDSVPRLLLILCRFSAPQLAV